MDTYWFPATTVSTTIASIQAGEFDLVASDNDANKKTGDLSGLEYYQIFTTGLNNFVANKFMLKELEALNYTVYKDIRFEVGDTVDIYSFWREANGTVTW